MAQGRATSGECAGSCRERWSVGLPSGHHRDDPARPADVRQLRRSPRRGRRLRREPHPCAAVPAVRPAHRRPDRRDPRRPPAGHATAAVRHVFNSVPQRIAGVLVQLTAATPRRTLGGRSEQVTLTHEQIAALVGTSRETATKILGEFADRRLPRLGRGRITLLDRDALAAETGDRPRCPPPAGPRTLWSIISGSVGVAPVASVRHVRQASGGTNAFHPARPNTGSGRGVGRRRV